MDNFLRKDWVLRAIALIVAIVVWAEVTGSADPIVTRTYAGMPIAVSGESSRTIARVDPAVGTIVLAGPESVMNGVGRRSVSLAVDVRGLKPGRYLLPVKPKEPAGTAVTALDPRQVTVTLAPAASYRRQVEVATMGTPAPGSYVTDLEYRPSVTISGPGSGIRRVVAVRAVVSVEGRAATFRQEVPLTPVDAKGQPVGGVTANPRVLSVRVVMRSYPSKRVAVRVPISGRPAGGFRVVGVTVAPNTVTIYGPAALLGTVSVLELPAISVNGFSTGFTRAVPLTLPPGLTANVVTVSVTVAIAPK